MKKNQHRKTCTDVILRQAIEDNDLAQLKFVLRFESDKINDQDENQMTALHWSTMHGRVEATGILLEHGADMEMKDSKGWTALHFAANGGYLDIVDLLMSSCADVTATSHDGKVAIDVARGDGTVFLLATGFIRAGKEALLLRYFSDSSASLRSIDELEEEGYMCAPLSAVSKEIWRASQHLLTNENKSSLKISTSEYGISKHTMSGASRGKGRGEIRQRKTSTPCIDTEQERHCIGNTTKQRLDNFDSSFSPGVLKRLAVSETSLNQTQEIDCNNNDNKNTAQCGTINRVSKYYALNTVESDTVINMDENHH